MILRRVNIDDHALVRELKLAALNDAPESFADSFEQTQQKSTQYWVGLTESLCSDHVMFIAKESGNFVGSVYGLCDSSNEKVGRVAGMWVSSTQRRCGVGKALLDEVVGWAESRKFEELHLWAPVNSAAAIAFYKSNGFETTGVPSSTPKPNLVIVEMKKILSEG